MKNNSSAALWSKLERLLLVEWKALDTDSASAKMSLNFEITETLLELFPNQDIWEVMGVFWTADLEKYDPEKGSFQSFVCARLNLRKKDMERKDQGKRRVTYKEAGQKRQKWVDTESLDVPLDEDQTSTRGDLLPDTRTVSGQERMEAEERAEELITLILLLPQRLNGQAKNPTRINYFRMFFTDGTVAALQTVGEAPYIAHERDLFEAMKVPFLDFFMREPCRTVSEIVNTTLKLYGQMVDGRPMELPEQPLPNDVYMQYLEQIEGMELKSVSTITNQRTAYRAFLKENLC